MYTTGRLCMKIAGRDAGRYCVIIEEKDGKVLIDGQTRRRYVNPNHLEPLKKTVKITKGATHEDVVKALKEHNITVVEHKPRSTKTENKETKKPAKKATKKTSKKPAKK